MAACKDVLPARRAIVREENGLMDALVAVPTKKETAIQKALAMATGNATVVTQSHMNAAMMNAILVNGIAFRVVENPFFVAMLQAAAKRGSDFQPMTVANLAAEMDASYALQIQISQARLNEQAGGGLMLCTDGAKAKSGQPLINFLVQTINGTVMLPTVDSSGEERSAVYLCGIMTSTLRAVGPAPFIAICADGANNIKAGYNMVVNAPDLRHIAFLPCMAHAADLQLSKICKLPWAEELTRRADIVCHFFRVRYMPCALLRAAAIVAGTPPTLIGRCDTRLATVFAMLHRLVHQEAVLKTLIISQGWLDWRARMFM